MFAKRKIPEQRRSPRAGNAPATVFSYHSNRSSPDVARARYEPPVTHRRGLQRLKHTPTLVATLVIVSTLIYASLLNSRPRVQVVASTAGASLQRPEAVYDEFITQQLSSSPLSKSKLTFNAEPIIAALEKQYPEIDSAIITLPLLGHRPIVKIAVASPAFILATSHGAYYVSDKGMPLVKVADVERQPDGIVTVTDETNLPIEPGKQVLPSDSVAFIASLLAHLSEAKVTHETVTLPLEPNEVRLRPAGEPYYVRFNTQQDARVQVGTYLAVKNRLESSREQPKEYIDVRVEERAYYK